MIIQDALNIAKNKLQKAEIGNYSWEAEELLSFVIKKDRTYTIAHSDELLTIKEKKKYFKLINKRYKRIPFAYLVGYQYFYGFKFLVNKNVLVPRSETEQIVEEVIEITSNKTDKINIIDIGVGSGCIAVSIYKTCHERINSVTGVDISKKALKVAKKNASILEAKILCKKSNLLDYFIKSKYFEDKKEIIIVANLPYVSKDDFHQKELEFEPKISLFSPEDGFRHYRQLAKQIKMIKEKFNTNIILICEAHNDQMSKLKQIFNFAKEKRIKKDLSGKDRILILSV